MFEPALRSRCSSVVLSIALSALASKPASCAERYSEKPGTEGNGNYTIGPEYKVDPGLTDLGNPKGKYFEFSMRLADSKIFRGTDSTLDPKKTVRGERMIYVTYRPPTRTALRLPFLSSSTALRVLTWCATHSTI